MKAQWVKFLAMIVGLTGCAVTPESLLRKAVPATDSAYGYDAAHAIPMKAGEAGISIACSRYFINHLRTSEGTAFRIAGRQTVDEPGYQAPLVKLQERSTGRPLYSLGLIDVYTLVSEGKTDTVRLYVNIYRRGPLQVPAGLRLLADEKL